MDEKGCRMSFRLFQGKDAQVRGSWKATIDYSPTAVELPLRFQLQHTQIHSC